MAQLILLAFLVPAGVYALVLLFFFFMQDRLLFAATRKLHATPKDIGRDFEDVRVDSGGGTTHGWWVPAVPERGVVLFSHGNAGNIADRLQSMELFLKMGLSVLIYDYGGYGNSTGKASEQRCYQDVRAMWRWLTETRGVSPSRIILFGRSLGGAVTADLAAEVRPAAVVLESTFTSLPDVAAKHFPWVPVRAFARSRFDSIRKVGRITAPVMFAHSVEDALVPHRHGRMLHEKVTAPKRFLDLRGDHNTGFAVSMGDYLPFWADFLRDVLPE